MFLIREILKITRESRIHYFSFETTQISSKHPLQLVWKCDEISYLLKFLYRSVAFKSTIAINRFKRIRSMEGKKLETINIDIYISLARVIIKRISFQKRVFLHHFCDALFLLVGPNYFVSGD